MRDLDAFVRAHTRIARVPFVPEIRIHTAATELDPIWRATQQWLDAEGVGIPFWCVPWAGGQALARWVLDHPAVVKGKRVIDFGTGSGLVAIAAAMAGAIVEAVDIDPFSIAACTLNAVENAVRIDASCIDIADLPVEADVLLAGDIWYEAKPAARFAAWLGALDAEVLSGDPGRAYVPEAAVELARYEVPTTLELESATSRTTRVLRLGAR